MAFQTLNMGSAAVCYCETCVSFLLCSIELFQKMCNELKDWIGEKDSALNNEDLGKDLRSVEALQRKHQNLEYDMEPLAEKLKKMNLLANAYV